MCSGPKIKKNKRRKGGGFRGILVAKNVESGKCWAHSNKQSTAASHFSRGINCPQFLGIFKALPKSKYYAL